ncbi:MAG: FecR domain-containing protein [Gammaproteobacteria bacterium]|nr:FecR domain-containing protein [Gammaproteobacteria bacterium]
MFRLLLTLLLALAIYLPNPVAAAEEHWEYTFRPGDSLWKIAEKYTTSVNNWGELLKINSIETAEDRTILPGTRISIPVSMLKLQPAPALVIVVSGAAYVVRADGEKAELTVGTELFSGDRVVTGEQQSLRMQFADKSVLQVLPNSEVVLDKLSQFEQTGMVDTRIRLNSGRVKTWVEKQKPDNRYEIKTPAAITAVRGTTFRLSSDDSQVGRTEVLEGNVAVSASDAEKDIKNGFGIVAEQDKPLPEPVKLLPPPRISGNLSQDKSKLRVSWRSLKGAEIYRYQLAIDEKFDQVAIYGSTEDSEIRLDELAPGQYFLRVSGVDQNELEGFDSTIGSFVIEEPVVKQFSIWSIIIPVGMILLAL